MYRGRARGFSNSNDHEEVTLCPGPGSEVDLWGGVECTINRVGDVYIDQLEQSGYADRVDDLDLFASLGVRALRFPLPWERLAPDRPDSVQWGWADERVARCRDLGIRPIVGLCHHGSGPRYTSLQDPAFAEKLGTFAARIAERYPWVDAYTPVNEPVTTARFSGLYGIWHPHARDEGAFLRILLNECAAVREAMRAVRAVNSSAELIQTEDLGRVYSDPQLEREAHSRRRRRFLGLDLLCGRVDPSHPAWGHLLTHGISTAELEAFLARPCPPDIIGVNHYVTSDRMLDSEVSLYPDYVRQNEHGRWFVDVEAVRAAQDLEVTPRGILREVWDRYRIPPAITEAHIGCTREEQLRWLVEIWREVNQLATEGIPVRALTFWALLGSHGWTSLVTGPGGTYETGAFDVRSGGRRETAVAELVRALAGGGAYQHPVLAGAGWWRRATRVRDPRRRTESTAVRARRTRPILITGARGTLGQAFARVCELRGLEYRAAPRQALDVTDQDAIDRALDETGAWAVVNAAGYVRVDDAEREPQHCWRVNAHAPAVLARACERRRVRLVTFSSDLVFGGDATERGVPYVESDPTAPSNVYGRTKAESERRVLEAHPSSLVVRTSAFFGPWDRYNFVSKVLETLRRGEVVTAARDQTVSPTYIPELVRATLDLLIDGEAGIWHLANAGATTWFELARLAAEVAGLEPRVRAARTEELAFAAFRPRYSAIRSERANLLGALEDALASHLEDA